MPGAITVVDVSTAGTIKSVLEAEGHEVGAGEVLLYSVQKKESVSAGKQVVLTKGSTHKVGEAARTAVGLPAAGSGSVGPADVPAGHTLFVQTTSATRVVPAGSSVAILHKAGAASAKGKAEPKAKAAGKAAAAGKAKAGAKAGAKAKAEAPEAVGESPAKKAKTGPATGGGGGSWTQHESVYVKDYGSANASEVAGYDMDSTLILTKSGKTFPQSKDDWKLWDKEAVPTKLQTLAERGAKIVIITNQGGVAKGQTKLGDIQAKLDNLQQELGVGLLAMILTRDDLYRKPLPSAWNLMETNFNSGVKVNRKKSLYCGDAAGRVPPVVKKKDFSANDLKFTLNLGVQFFTPEEHFLGATQAYEKNKFDFDPRTLGLKPSPYPVPVALKKQTLILCIGPPGSGKSSAALQHFKTCVRVNQDTLKTKAKCLQACEAALKEGKSVIVDNQNKQASDRKPYLELAKTAGADSIAILYNVPKELCFHLNAYRMLNTSSELHRPEKVPSMIIHSFFKSLEEPKKAEGFTAVYTVGLEHFTVNKEDVNLDLLRSFID